MTRRPTGTPANHHGSGSGARRTGARPRRATTPQAQVVDDALTLPVELRNASGLTIHTLRRLLPHRGANVYADPKTGQVYSARLHPIGRPSGDGYVRIGRPRPGQEQYAHRIVYEAVNGTIPAGYQVDHRNHQKADNRIVNLRAVTPLENVRASVRRGRIPSGSGIPNARLDDEVVRQIRAHGAGKRDVEWAAELGIHASTIRLARIGKTWRHVKPCPRLRNRARPRSRR